MINKPKTKYAKAALNAVNLIKTGIIKSPVMAWEKATSELFGEGTSGQSKSCPRNAFLGLCEDGHVIGIEKGSYTTSEKNKGYALRALKVLKSDPDSPNQPSKLWQRVIEVQGLSHNSQMDVVLALWHNGYLS